MSKKSQTTKLGKVIIITSEIGFDDIIEMEFACYNLVSERDSYDNYYYILKVDDQPVYESEYVFDN